MADRLRRGQVLVALSALAFSTAGLFTRLVGTGIWATLFWRALFGGLLILCAVAWTERRGTLRALAGLGPAGLLVAFCSTAGTICFIAALRLAPVAEVTMIYALAPFLAALLGWLWGGERPDARTLLASALALVGVVALFGSSAGDGGAGGRLLALAMTALMAAMMVVIRHNRHVSMLPAACVSAFACAALVWPWAPSLAVSGRDLLLLPLFGATQFGLGLLLLTLGSRLIPAPQASLLSNLELPCAPALVWLAVGEVPTRAVALAGAVVLAAVLLDLWPRRAPQRCAPG